MKRVRSWTSWSLTKVIQSVEFFYFTLFLFLAQAIWIAFSAVFAMPFDERTHVTLIDIYSHRLLPFWSSMPAGPASYGPISRDPSYLFYYLMSWPYRLFHWLFSSSYATIICLRLINVAIVAIGIWVARRVLANAGLSKALTNAVIFLLVLTPIVSFLAAQVNYDNPLFTMTMVCLLVAQKQLQKFDKKQVDLAGLLTLFTLCCLTTLIKYAFLPIFLAIGCFMVYKLIRLLRQTKDKSVFFSKIYRQFIRTLSPLRRAVLIVMVVMASGLFIERYGINLIRYHTPAPECDQVAGIQACQYFGPWKRNSDFAATQAREHKPLTYSPSGYANHWVKASAAQLFYVLNNNTRGKTKVGGPTTLTKVASLLAMIFGAILFLAYQERIRKKYKLDFLMFVMFTYAAILFIQNYTEYRHLAQPVAIQGRYLLPVVPIIYAVVAVGYANFLRTSQLAKSMLITIVAGFLLTQGGGVGIYILRSDPTWYWPNRIVIRMNERARKVLSKLALGA